MSSQSAWVWKAICRFMNGEEAPTMVEYGLLLALIVLMAVVGVRALGVEVAKLLQVPPEYFESDL